MTYVFRKTYLDDIIVPTGICNIPIIDGHSMTNQRFLMEFAYKQPFVIRDGTDNTVKKSGLSN
jgi:hypothetical protein